MRLKKSILLILFVLSTNFTYSQNIKLYHTLVKETERQIGTYCGKTSIYIKVKNVTNKKIWVQCCFQKEDCKWTTSTGSIEPDKETSFYECKTSGWYILVEKYDNPNETWYSGFPTTDELNEKYKNCLKTP